MKNLLLLIVMSIKLLIRGSFLLCLTMGPLMANTSKAQVKSIDEVFIKLDRKSYSLTRFFKETEKQTDFKFLKINGTIPQKPSRPLLKDCIPVAAQQCLSFRNPYLLP